MRTEHTDTDAARRPRIHRRWQVQPDVELRHAELRAQVVIAAGGATR